jgi:exonuclease SbcC
MRIQAIRGCNLASLEGEFAVDLDSGPLAASGLFAITGPTGAGKSTCSMRCVSRSLPKSRACARPRPGPVWVKGGGDEDGLSAGDPRAILRHGSGEGYAEIDFRMPDGATYRARWAVRRARGKPDGAIQNHTHTFERTDRPENLGGTNTQTKQAIGQVIGLSAEQFTRAVLLAQGDFEALIRADADERAALLEKLTGSHIYSALGRKAFEDKRAWTEKLDAITAKITALEGLTPDAREAAQACFDAARDHHHACQTGLKALEDRQALLATRDRLAQAARRAQEACTDAQAAIAGALPGAALARDRQALTLEPLYSRCREEAEAQTRATDARQAAAHALAETESRATASETRHNEARADHDAQTLHAQTLKPRIDKARLLEEQIAQAAGQAETLDTRRRDSAKAARQSEQTLATSQTRHDEATTHLNAVKAWQDARAALRPLAERESEIAALLTSHDAARARIGEQDARLSALAQAVEAAQEARDAAQEARRKAEDRHTAARTALAQAQAANTGHLGAEHLAALTTRAQALAAAVLADAAARTARQQADERANPCPRRRNARHARGPAPDPRHADRRPRGRTHRPCPALDAARARHERAAQASDQAAQIMRAALHDGEPCPVCGAREHPTDALQALLGDNLVAARDEARALQDRHDALTADIAAKTRQAADLDETLREARAAHEALARTCAALHAQGEAREDEARASAARADLPDALPDARGPALAALSKANQAEIDAGLAAQRMLASLRQQQDAARAALDQADAALAEAEQTLRDQNTAHQATASEQAQTRAQQDRLAAELSHLLAPSSTGRPCPIRKAGWPGRRRTGATGPKPAPASNRRCPPSPRPSRRPASTTSARRTPRARPRAPCRSGHPPCRLAHRPCRPVCRHRLRRRPCRQNRSRSGGRGPAPRQRPSGRASRTGTGLAGSRRRPHPRRRG